MCGAWVGNKPRHCDPSHGTTLGHGCFPPSNTLLFSPLLLPPPPTVCLSFESATPIDFPPFFFSSPSPCPSHSVTYSPPISCSFIMFNEENASDLELSHFQPVRPLSPGLSRQLQVFLAAPAPRNLTRDVSRTVAFPRPQFVFCLPAIFHYSTAFLASGWMAAD